MLVIFLQNNMDITGQEGLQVMKSKNGIIITCMPIAGFLKTLNRPNGEPSNSNKILEELLVNDQQQFF